MSPAFLLPAGTVVTVKLLIYCLAFWLEQTTSPRRFGSSCSWAFDFTFSRILALLEGALDFVPARTFCRHFASNGIDHRFCV